MSESDAVRPSAVVADLKIRRPRQQPSMTRPPRARRGRWPGRRPAGWRAHEAGAPLRSPVGGLGDR